MRPPAARAASVSGRKSSRHFAPQTTVRVPDGGVYVALGWVTKGQLLSVPMVLFGVLLLWLAFRSPEADSSTTPGTRADEPGSAASNGAS